MAHHNEQDKSGRCFEQGQKAEDFFADIARSKGYQVQSANRFQETREHWDFLLVGKTQSFKVEVKSKKAFPVFHNGKKTFDWILVEFSGITGHAGWMYGKADHVAFEMDDHFLSIPRTQLVALAENLISTDRVSRKEEMLYKSYGRQGRQDEVGGVLVSDLLMYGNCWKWEK